MRSIILAGFVLALGASGAHADPVLTPLLVTAATSVGFTAGAATVVASIATWSITAGAAFPMVILGRRR